MPRERSGIPPVEDPAAFLDWLRENGYAVALASPDGERWVGIRRLIFHWTMHVGRVGDRSGFDRRFCYRDFGLALGALVEWSERGFEGEPEGWDRDPLTGRRRPEGDPAREFVDA